MSNVKKGILVALAAVALVTLRIGTSGEVEEYGDVGSWLFVMILVAIPVGAYAGSLAGRLRSDRALHVAAIGLAVPVFAAYASMIVRHPPFEKLVMKLLGVSAIPILVAAFALARWTRPIDLIPEAKQRRWRSPTIVELAVVLSMVAAIVTGGLIVLGKHAPLDEYSYMYRRGTVAPWQMMLMLVGAAVPIGVMLGRVASGLRTCRLFVLVTVAGAGALWIGHYLDQYAHVEFRWVYLIPAAIAVLALWRLTRPTEKEPLGSVALGVLLGCANGIAITAFLLGLVVSDMKRWDWQFTIFLAVSLLFAAPMGAVIGGLAGMARTSRRAIMLTIAMAAVFVIAAGFELPITTEPTAFGFFAWACCTTVFGVLLLERATRPKPLE